MELLGAVVSLIECVSPHFAKRWEYHRDFCKNKEALVEALDKLNRRKTDIEATLDAMVVPGVTEIGSEVVGWLQRADKISREVEDIEKEVRDVKFFSHAKLGRKIVGKKLQVDEFYEEGQFPEGSLVKSLPRRGDVIPTPNVLKGQTTFQKIVEEIWGRLLDDGITKIGVFGMGGVGKTTAVEHINNRLLEDEDKFDKVIWVTVSSKSTIKTLQEKLARKLELDISGIDDEEAREAKKQEAKSRDPGSYAFKWVQIVIDNSNSSSLSLSLLRCGGRNESSIGGRGVAIVLRKGRPRCFVESELGKSLKQVARECARLPLAIIVVAGSLRSKTDPNEWEVASIELKGSSARISDDVMRNLRLSYDLLNDETLKGVILYCALFPEDYSIERSLLIDQLIAVGIVEDIKTRQYQVGKGQVLLNELVNVCLLNCSFNNEGAPSVEMHDLIRDMAIQIMRETPQRFLVRASEELEYIPGEEHWGEDLEKVTLTENKIVEISSSKEPPNCPELSTLFLDSNHLLKSIPDNFFCHMKGLNVLNLSRSAIISLPESISELVNLAILLLEDCNDLTSVPSLENLTNMKRLNMRGTRIVEIPKGIEMMVKLTHLDLSSTRVRVIPDGVLRKLTNLESLSFVKHYKIMVNEDELCNHIKLETFEASLDLSCYNTIIRYFEKIRGTGLTNMKFLVLPPDVEFISFVFDASPNIVMFVSLKRNCDNDLRILLPKNIKNQCMDRCETNQRSLSELFSLTGVVNLVEIKIFRCGGIEPY